MLILFYYFLSKSAVVNRCSVFSNFTLSYSTEQSSKFYGFLNEPILLFNSLSSFSIYSFFSSRIFNSSSKIFLELNFYLRIDEYLVRTICVFFLFSLVFFNANFRSFIKPLFFSLSTSICFLSALSCS